jgi:hypothetical protein
MDDFSLDIDFDEEGDGLVIELNTVLSDIGIAGIKSLYDEAPVKLPTSSLSEQIQKSTKDYAAELVTGINETTRDRINNAMTMGIDKGLSVDDMKQYLIDNNIINDSYRAEMIARTESVSAYSRGRDSYAKESGATSHFWETQSGKPCSDCQESENDGEIPINQAFSSGWDSPDDSHPNCQCIVSYGYDKE